MNNTNNPSLFKSLKPSTLVIGGLVVIVLLSLAIFRSPAALKALKQDQRVSQYDESYWAAQKKQDSLLWRQAIKYCEHRGTVNCAPVMNVQIIMNGSTNVPAYGTSSQYIDVNKFAPKAK